ncbi:MAG: antibiotic biosynthesis monooxygenase [Rhodospirillales bacterium]|jgi:heme-degrading monooxygenase HmoA|nr:antibiotic biosynthesis monooxygenase [Rhodospirillales bacterium]MDP6773497.1 antibiotic biosynthesis monooxygenase [Rhodospirillales bacterium]|tara:strand:+ start:93 stop:398 length:306 start_codon:yes stop_codon:yes gene_type:complete
MIVVLFEVTPKPGRAQDYFDMAAELRPELEKIDGFISVERFESRTEEGKYLSFSVWRDEEAVRAWREVAEHQAAQNKGKSEIFDRYRIRVAEVVRDYGFES